MTDRNKRGKASKIDLLPAPIKEQLDTLLREKKVSQQDIVEAINEMVVEQGLPEDAQVSKSGVNRYSTRMYTAGKRIMEARYVADQLFEKLGDKPTNNVSKALIEMVRGIAFENILTRTEDDEPVNPKLIKDLAIAIERLEKADSESDKREHAIRKRFAEEAVNKVDDLAQQAGLTKEGAANIKKEILGIA